jgi:HD-GYP domain-containing protein (c-di-GMP phosphodiesterase class II)
MAEDAKESENKAPLAYAQEDTETYRSYMELIERLDQVFLQISAGIGLTTQFVDDIAIHLLHVVRGKRDSIIGFILGGEVSGYEHAKSSVNTAILSALIAMELKQPDHKVMQVITGALLHDVGMLRLPKELVNKRGVLSAEELEKMRTHPLYAYKIANSELHYPEGISSIVLHHHEHWNGEGYPSKLAGADIDMGARIVSVADAFEAMVSQKPYRNSMKGYQAMKNILSDNSMRFDPDVLKAFIRIMGIYPIGSFVLLNNGIYGRVTEVHSDAPLRPKIQLLIDESGNVYAQDEQEFIDLLNDKQFFITRAVAPKEINEKYA